MTAREARGTASEPVRKAFGIAISAAALLWLGLSAGWEWAVIIPVLVKVAVYAVSAFGLNLHFGHTGLLNFGHVGFMLVGAYTMALLVPHALGRAGTQSGGFPLWLATIVAMLAAAALGLLLGIPTLRLRGDYLAIATIAIAEILRFFARSFEFTGQTFGILQFTASFQDLRPGVVDDWAAGLGIPGAKLWLLIVAWAVVGIVYVVLRVLLRFPWGRVLRAIREDEDAARALGKNAYWYKLQSLMLGGAIGGLAGVLLALDLTQINPGSFLPQETFFVWTIVILGGAASLGGPIAGSLLFWVILTQTDNLASDVLTSLSPLALAQIRFVLLGLMIMGLMIFRPQGLFGKREELSLELG